ncbi:MAG: metallophosphoesterase family protein [Candidatus Rokuibacteriota bacterium]
MERSVGVIADTHGLLRPEAVAALARVDLIVHAGDIGSRALLDELGAIAPVLAVRGNNDREPWAAVLPETATTEIAGVRLYVIHDLARLPGSPASLGADVVISGHSHKPGVARRDGLLWLNPGSAGPRRFSLPIAVARLSLGPGGARAEIVELDIPAGSALPRRRGGLDAAKARGAVSPPGRGSMPGRVR